MKLGVKKGDHLAIWATNVPEWVVLQFATAKIGAVLVTVNTSYKSAELEYILKQSDATTLFLVQGFKDTDYVETLYQVVPELKTASSRATALARASPICATWSSSAAVHRRGCFPTRSWSGSAAKWPTPNWQRSRRPSTSTR